jgi:Protein of unknown function (DUF3631)
MEKSTRPRLRKPVAGASSSTDASAPSPVAVMDEGRHQLTRFVRFRDEHQAVAVTLWVAHTYAFSRFRATPYLHVLSPVKGCGKTTLLRVIKCLSHKPWFVSDITPAVLYRRIEDQKPTLLLDEVDATFGQQGEKSEALRGLLDNGFEYDGIASRCEVNGKGGITTRDFSVFCPKAFGSKGLAVPETILDRSITISLWRDRPPEEFELETGKELEPVADRLSEAMSTLDLSGRPATTLSGRQKDCWRPLLTIADAVGGPWPDQTRTAAAALQPKEVAEPSDHELLLAHVRDAFEEDGTGRISSRALLGSLTDRDDGPWATWWGRDVRNGELRGPGYKLSRMLQDFGITPEVMKINGTAQRGYRRDWFIEAWDHFLPHTPTGRNHVTAPAADPPNKPVTSKVTSLHPPGGRAPERNQDPSVTSLHPPGGRGSNPGKPDRVKLRTPRRPA